MISKVDWRGGDGPLPTTAPKSREPRTYAPVARRASWRMIKGCERTGSDDLALDGGLLRACR